MKPASALAALGAAVIVACAGCGGRPDDDIPAAEPRAATAASARDFVAAAASPAAVGGQAGDAAAQPASAVARATAGNDVAQLARDVAQLRSEVAELRSQLARTPTAAPAPKAPALRFDAEARQQAERAEAQRLATSEAAFRDEPLDAAWSRSASADVHAALAQGGNALVGQVRSVECRSRSCRVEIDADAARAARDELVGVFGALANVLPNTTAGSIDPGDGRQALVLYMARAK